MTNPRMTLIAILFSTAIVAAAPQRDTFRVTAEEVRIDALVTENGRPVSRLEAADFEVFDNGVPQEIRYAALQKDTPISATLVFDLSRSVAGELLDSLKEAASALLDDFKTEDHAALITFNNAVALGSPPTRDFAGVRRALDKVKAFGNSALIDACYAGLTLAETRPDPPLLIIFSDGRDTFSWLTERAALETAKRSHAVVYTVSTGMLPKKAFLRDVTDLTGGTLFEVESTRNLPEVFVGILNEFRRRYLLTYTPQGVPEAGWHELVVRVNRSSARVRARPGYVRRNSAGN